MADTVTLTLAFPHHDWIRIRAFALAKRQILDDVVADALREDLHKIGQHEPLPKPETFSERLTAIASLLAQADVLTAAFTAALHDPTVSERSSADAPTMRAPVLREPHVRFLPDHKLTIRPKVPASLWYSFKGYSYVYGKDPTQAVTAAILQHVGKQLLGAADPADTAPIAQTLTEVIETLTQLRREMDEPGFGF